MPASRRPRDPIARAKVVMDMLIGEVPNDKDEILGRVPDQENGHHAKAAKARAASQTPERRREVARHAAATRWANP